MIQNVIQHLGAIKLFGVASLCLFALLFAVLLLWALLQKRTHLERMARLPLEPDATQTRETNEHL